MAHSTARDDLGSPFWAAKVAWYALLVALVASLVLTDPPGIYSGMYFFKDVLVRGSVSIALVFWGYALLKRRVVVRWHPAVWLAVGWLSWAAVCTALSVGPATSLNGAALGEAGLLALASCAVGGFLTLQLADRATRIRSALRVVALSAGLVAAYGLLQTLGVDPMRWGETDWGSLRSFGTLGNPDMFGAYMSFAFPLAIGQSVAEQPGRWKGLLGGAAVLTGTAVFTSLTRSAWIGGTAGAVALFGIVWQIRVRIGRFEVLEAVALVALIAAFTLHSLAAVSGDSNVTSRIRMSRVDRNVSARIETWKAGGRAVLARPVLGWGPDAFQMAFESHRTEEFSRIVDPRTSQTTAHNWVVQTAVETGLPGVLGLLALFGVIAWISIRWTVGGPDAQLSARVRAAGAWAGCAGGLTTLLLTPGSPPARLLIWCLLGVLLSPLAVRTDGGTGRLQRAAARSALGLGMAGFVLAVVALAADTQARIGADPDQPPLSRVAAADGAMRLNPLCAEYSIVGIDAHTALVPIADAPVPGATHPDLDAALRIARTAVRLEPLNPYRETAVVSTLLIGAQDVAPEYAAQALAVAEEAHRRAPNNLHVGYWYARALLEAGRRQEAMASLEQTLSVRPGFRMAALLLSDLYAQDGDPVHARSVLEAILAQVEDPEVEAALRALSAVDP